MCLRSVQALQNSRHSEHILNQFIIINEQPTVIKSVAVVMFLKHFTFAITASNFLINLTEFNMTITMLYY